MKKLTIFYSVDDGCFNVHVMNDISFTLLFRINVCTRLLNSGLFSNQHALIRDTTFIRFQVFFGKIACFSKKFIIAINRSKYFLSN